MAWLLLIGAGLLEIVWAIALEYADGFTRPLPGALGVAPGSPGGTRPRLAMGRRPRPAGG